MNAAPDRAGLTQLLQDAGSPLDDDGVAALNGHRRSSLSG